MNCMEGRARLIDDSIHAACHVFCRFTSRAPMINCYYFIAQESTTEDTPCPPNGPVFIFLLDLCRCQPFVVAIVPLGNLLRRNMRRGVVTKKELEGLLRTLTRRDEDVTHGAWVQ